jgi:osmoprotectant transport system ATP-binding protein
VDRWRALVWRFLFHRGKLAAVSALVQLVGVSKTFGDAAAVHAIDLSVERGKTTVLIGPSGCGKSTLLRLIIGLLQPDSGQIQFDGAKIDADKPARRSLGGGGIDTVRRHVGYVIQEGGLFPHLTARGNILLMARHLGRPENEMLARLSELCALTRFPENLLGRYPLELSGGQRQRVSLMRALMLSPELLLLDEPLGALDPLVRAALQKDLKEIFARLRQTALLVTHDLAEAAYLGDEIVLVNEGRIVQQGSLADLREKPASSFVSEFINAQRSLAVI